MVIEGKRVVQYSPIQDERNQSNPMNTILLLVMSNIFMAFAWYGHLKYGHAWPLWKASFR